MEYPQFTRFIRTCITSHNRMRLPTTVLLPLVALMMMSMQTGAAQAASSVTVGSVDVLPGQAGVTIPVLIVNDVLLSSIFVPLIIREVSGGAYITSLQLQLEDRLGTLPAEIQFTNILQADGACGVDGLGTLLFNDQNSHPVSPPVGALLVWQTIFSPDLPPGADATGSLLLTIDVALPEGVFEIDVSCADPSFSLLFLDSSLNVITPTFQKGTITVGGLFSDGFESGDMSAWGN